MRFAVLGSGSKGNALVVQGGGVTILVDAGFSPRELKRRLQALELALTDVRALVVTHGHSDHVKGARQLASALAIPTYATDGTRRFCARFGALHNHEPVTPGEPFAVGGLTVRALATAHDAAGSVCFFVDDGDERLAVVTDLGEPSAEIAQALSSCRAVLLEHNHDAELLRTGPYPAHLKRRIASSRGHLSNAQGAALLAAARGPLLSRVLLGHLSEVNNTPALALAAARPAVDGADIEVACAPQHHPTGWLRVQRARTTREELVTRLQAAPYTDPPVDTPAPPPRPGHHRALDAQLALFATKAQSTRSSR